LSLASLSLFLTFLFVAQILVAEDSLPLQRLLKVMLGKQLGHMPVVVENGSEALDRLKSDFGHFDLLVTDLQMPVRTPA
jgi:hypothetical protein